VNASDAGNVNGAFCKVTGVVTPQHAGSPGLEFEVNLPFAWNRRALQMGGGGYDGSLVIGLGHGVFNAKFDSLGVLRDRVENGKAPSELVAMDGNPNANRTRLRTAGSFQVRPHVQGLHPPGRPEGLHCTELH